MSKMKILFLGLALITSAVVKAAALNTSAYIEIDPSCPAQAQLVSAKLDGVEWMKGGEASRALAHGDVLHLIIGNNGAEHNIELKLSFPSILFPDFYRLRENVEVETRFKLGGAVGGEYFYKLTGSAGDPLVFLRPSAALPEDKRATAIEFNMAE